MHPTGKCPRFFTVMIYPLHLSTCQQYAAWTKKDYLFVLLYRHCCVHRPRGRPYKKCLQNNIRERTADLEITLYEATQLAKDRHQWRHIDR